MKGKTGENGGEEKRKNSGEKWERGEIKGNKGGEKGKMGGGAKLGKF